MANACTSPSLSLLLIPSSCVPRSRVSVQQCIDKFTPKRSFDTSFTLAVVDSSCRMNEWKWGLSKRKQGKSIGDLSGGRLQVRAAVADILHNQVLVSSGFAAILGQLVKPATSAILGKGFNWKLIVRPGGMPSTHSASVTAAATALGLERGLSDSIFGLSVILASLVMYDAQGVRRSVGKQAEVINTMVFSQMGSYVQSKPSSQQSSNPSPFGRGVDLASDPAQGGFSFEEGLSSTEQLASRIAVASRENSVEANGSLPTELVEEKPLQNGAFARARLFREKIIGKLPSVREGQVTLQEVGDVDGWRHIPLKESVGHTKLEVLVGAVWGILVALGLHSSIQ